MRSRWRRASAAGSAPAKVAWPVSRRRCTDGPGRGHEGVDVGLGLRPPCPCGGGRRAAGPRRERHRRPRSCGGRTRPIRRAPRTGRSSSGFARRHGWRSRSRRGCSTLQPIALSRSRCGRSAAMLVLGGAGQELGRMPAGDELEAVAVEHRLQRRRLTRELVAQLHAFEARPPWPRRGRSRGVVAPPSERRSSFDQPIGLAPIADHRQSTRRLRSQRALVRRARASHLGALGDLGHGDVPPVRRRPRWSASGSVSMTMTSSCAAAARAAERRLELGEARDLLGHARRGSRHGRRSRSAAASRGGRARTGC